MRLSFCWPSSAKRMEGAEEDWQRLVAPPIGLCVGSPARQLCPLEEQLVRQRVLPRRERPEVGPTVRPVVIIREPSRAGARAARPLPRVPGPRLRYSQGEHTRPVYC